MVEPIRGRTREIGQKINVPVEAKIHNRFDIEVIDCRTGKVRQTAQAENVICSQLWTRLFTPNTYFNYIQYGTGSGTPSASDTHLFSFLGYGTPASGNDVWSLDEANGIASIRRKIQLSETTAAGSTITEVGIGYSSDSSSLCTHAMLKDMNGNQISITKTNTDIINIYATVFSHFPGDMRKCIAFSLSANVYLFKWPLGMAGGLDSGITYYGLNLSSITKSQVNTFVAATKTVTSKVARLAAGEGNFGGITKLATLAVSDLWFNGSTITGEAIGTGDGTTKDFATDFGFVKPGAKIYVDGVETAATVDIGVPTYTTNLIAYLIPVNSSGCYDTVNFSYPKSIAYGKSVIFYNPFYATMGITNMSPERWSGYISMDCSNDLVNWVSISTSEAATIPVEYKNYKYWRVSLSSAATSNAELDFTSSDFTGKNIHFEAPPASGAVITSDYSTPLIAKDSNHVFDLTVTIQLGEYTT